MIKKNLQTYLGVLFLLISLSQNAQLCFNPVSIYSVVTSTSSPSGGVQKIISADFNGDGHQDIAISDNNTNVNFIKVLLGSASGTFTSTINSTLGNTIAPGAFTSADYNGDNKPDLAVAQPNSASNGSISILIGTGSGSFTPYSIINFGSGLGYIKSADFNLDGKQDLVVGRGGMNVDSIAVYFGNGNGTFAPVQKFKTGYGQSRLLTADFNNDGKPDILCSNTVIGGLTLLLGTGTGGFGTATSFSFPTSGSINVYEIVSSDFNNDGKPDVATLGFNNINVLLGTGTGSFLPSISFTAGIQLEGLTSSDYNGDGKVDLAVSDYSTGPISVLFGDGLGGFSAPNIIPNIPNRPIPLISGDFDGNGKADFAVGNYQPEQVTVLLNKTPLFNVYTSTNTICKGSTAVITVTGETTNTYTWSTAQTGTNITVSPTINTIFFVTASANGCTNTKSVAIVVNPCDYVGLRDISSQANISIFPNPFTSMIQIMNANEASQSIVITDVSGKKIHQQFLTPGMNTIDLSYLNKGMYFIEISDTAGNFARNKIIKD